MTSDASMVLRITIATTKMFFNLKEVENIKKGVLKSCKNL